MNVRIRATAATLFIGVIAANPTLAAENRLSAAITIPSVGQVQVEVVNDKITSSYPFDRTALWGGSADFPAKDFLKAIIVTVAGQRIPLPLSCFADLTSATGLKVKPLKAGFSINLHGADAGLAWEALLVIHGTMLEQRIVSSGEFPDYREVTQYPVPTSSQ